MVEYETVWLTQLQMAELFQTTVPNVNLHLKNIHKGHKLLQIGGMSDHIHALVSMSPKQAPSDLMADVKRSSSLWINDKRFVMGKFSWQEGFGAFSYGKSQIPDIASYIENQEIHHKRRTFMEEYLEFLRLYEIEYDERYVFKPVE
jgi:REP element-mobilizing transposase RayT